MRPIDDQYTIEVIDLVLDQFRKLSFKVRLGRDFAYEYSPHTASGGPNPQVKL